MNGFDRARLGALIRDVPDFPEPGVLFKDLTPLLRDPTGLRGAIEALVDVWAGIDVQAVAGIEARGFIFAAPVAEALGVGFIPIRKPGKLPWRTVRHEYALEYGTDALEVHVDAVSPGDRILVIDDVLATGGTAEAAGNLLRQLDATVVGYGFVVELAFLGGRGRLGDLAVHSLFTYGP